jgi:predicted nucleic acid-binding protein
MGPVVLDTSVVIAVMDPSDRHHSAAVAEVTARRDEWQAMKLSSISVAELCSLKGPGRKQRLEWVDRFIGSLGADAVVSVDRHTAELAGAVRANRPSLRLPDALISATAQQIGAELLTADRRLARLDGVKLLSTRH